MRPQVAAVDLAWMCLRSFAIRTSFQCPLKFTLLVEFTTNRYLWTKHNFLRHHSLWGWPKNWLRRMQSPWRMQWWLRCMQAERHSTQIFPIFHPPFAQQRRSALDICERLKPVGDRTWRNVTWSTVLIAIPVYLEILVVSFTDKIHFFRVSLSLILIGLAGAASVWISERFLSSATALGEVFFAHATLQSDLQLLFVTANWIANLMAAILF